MPSNEEKKPDKETGKTLVIKGKKQEAGEAAAATVAKKPRKHLSIGWWFGIIVLVLISISFVLAPALEAVVAGKQGNGLVFGKYGKEEIKFIQGNYFYDQYQNYANQYKASDSTNPTQAVYQIWMQAYQSTVIYTAVNQMAKKAGISTSNAVVNRKIIESGYYNKDGKFDMDTYNKASAEQKSSIETSIRRTVPMQIVTGDVASVLSSSAESDFVAAMADEGKAFKYVGFDGSMLPDEKASEYALQNPQLFYQLDLSVISAASKEDADAVVAKINDKSQSFEDAAKASSTDTYAANGGKVGNVYFFQVNTLFKNVDEAQNLFNANSGDVIGPFESSGSWMVYRLDSTPVKPDFADAQTLLMVKSYMANYEQTLVSDYLSGKAADFVTEAKATSFQEAADKENLTVSDVSATPLNIGGSSFISSFAYTDQQGMLTNISTDSDKMKTLYDTEKDAITAPIQSGSSYLVAEAGETSSSGMGNYLKNFYSYLVGSGSQQDLAQSILGSDQFEDNFLSVFLTNIIGTSSSKS